MKKYTVSLNGGVAGRVTEDDDPLSLENPTLGFYWFYYLPSMRSNNGKFSKRHIVDVSFYWLCFWCSITFWPKVK